MSFQYPLPIRSVSFRLPLPLGYQPVPLPLRADDPESLLQPPALPQQLEALPIRHSLHKYGVEYVWRFPLHLAYRALVKDVPAHVLAEHGRGRPKHHVAVCVVVGRLAAATLAPQSVVAFATHQALVAVMRLKRPYQFPVSRADS